MRRILRLVRMLTTILLGIVAGLILCELAVRLLVRPDPVAQNTWSRVEMTRRHVGELHVPDPVLGWRNRPGADTVFESPEFRVHVRINQHGLRGGEITAAPSPGHRRVLLLGDSFVFGWGVGEDETFAAELARRLPDTETIAMGVAGYGTDQELIWLRDEGLRLQPDLVIACFYVNDLIDNVSPVRWGRPKATFRLVADGILTEVPAPPEAAPGQLAHGSSLPAERIDDWMVSHVRLYGLLRPRLAALAVRAGWITPEEGLDDYIGYFRRSPSANQEEQWALALAELAAMEQVARASGARLAVLAVPAKVQVEKDVRARVLRAYGLREAEFDFDAVAARLQTWGRREGIPILSVRAEMERVAAAQPLYFQLDGHWNRAGHRVAGAALASELARLAQR